MSADRRWQSTTVPGTETAFWSRKGLGNQVRSNEFVHFDRSKLLSLKQIMTHVLALEPERELRCSQGGPQERLYTALETSPTVDRAHTILRRKR